MYDKYYLANPLTFGSKLPKHRGLLISGGSAGTPAFNANFVNYAGTTFTASLTINLSPYILPMQVHSIPSALPTGLTGYYLS